MVKRAKINPDQPWVAVDVDHTISGAWWRDPIIQSAQAKGVWDEYYADQHLDPPIEEVVLMLRALKAGGWGIAGLTAREDKYRTATTRYMVDHDIPMDTLIMRPREDYRGSAPLKLAMLRLAFPGYQGIKMVIDDREDVCRAFLGIGITAIQVMAVPRDREGKMLTLQSGEEWAHKGKNL